MVTEVLPLMEEMALGGAMRDLARRWRPRPGGWVRWGNIRRRAPFSSQFGWDRGVPVDRFYIDRFLRAHADCIRGHVLEVRDAHYARRYGRDRVERMEIVDIDTSNTRATLHVDLALPGALPPETYDAAVVTQTLQYVADPLMALRNLYGALRPGGTLLLTAPCIQRICDETPDADRWRFTPAGLEQLVEEACPGARHEVRGHGNVLAGVAALIGVSREELAARELDADDAAFPAVVSAAITRP